MTETKARFVSLSVSLSQKAVNPRCPGSPYLHAAPALSLGSSGFKQFSALIEEFLFHSCRALARAHSISLFCILYL